MHQRSSRTALGGVTMALALALVVGTLALTPGTTRADDETVNMQGLSFVPSTVNINVGDTVTWINTTAGVPHTTTSDTDLWDSGNLNVNETFAFTFNTAGTFPYHCEIHPTMTGTVIVAQQTTATATTTTATATATTATATATTPATSTPTSTSTATPTATSTVPAATATSTATTAATVAPGPPATGSGTVSGTNNGLLLLAAALGAAGLSGGAFVAIRRRI